MDLSTYALFDNRDRPTALGIRCSGQTKIIDLYRSGSRKTIFEVNNTIKTLRGLFKAVIASNGIIRTSDYKLYIKAFDLESLNNYSHIYDYHLSLKSSTAEQDHKTITMVLDHIDSTKPQPYQNIIANVSEVYHRIEQNGLILNYDMVYPKWHMNTFSGRSKTTGFCIHGYTHPDIIRPINSAETDYVIHFDWISADIRAASLLSNDIILQNSFQTSDPYSFVASELGGSFTRDECKLLLLKAINSLDFTNPVLDIFPYLKSWLRDVSITLDQNKPVYTLLGRKFVPKLSRNKLAALNGVTQGTVAHAMQLSLKRIWDKIGNRIIAETHDSIAISARRDDIISTIETVGNIMLYPLSGHNANSFPLKVNVGRRWKLWEPFAVVRESGIEYVKTFEEITARVEQKEIEIKALQTYPKIIENKEKDNNTI